MSWPSEVRINAYIGDGKRAASGLLTDETKKWPLRNAPAKLRAFLKPPAPVDRRKWQDPSVGWGIVAAEKPGLTKEQLASGTDLPEPIQQLRKDRGNAPVFRYRPGCDQRFRLLRNYASSIDVAMAQSPQGIGPESIPTYLLIYGGPDEVPWELQYILSMRFCVGRVHLGGTALENYVAALRSGWAGAASDPRQPVVWAVSHGGDDITTLMRDVLAAPVYDKLSHDTDIAANASFLDGTGTATCTKLTATLAARKPGLVVTTSHGQTYPLDNITTLSERLGLPVDQDYISLLPEGLLAAWQPDGVVWYAHACCSAGSSAQTIFSGFTAAGSEIDRILLGVAALGNRVAPLPTALLGAKKPARAFIGHIEPTFDWTLRNPDTNQTFGTAFQSALYSELYQPSPIGYAIRSCYEAVALLYNSYDLSEQAFRRGENTREAMLKDLLAARDLQSLVILGDPVATFVK